MKTIGRLILTAIVLVLTGLMVAFAYFAPGLVFSFYPEFSRKALGAISSVTSLLPFSLWEILLGLMILWLLYTLVRVFTKKKGFFHWLAGVLLWIAVMLFLFVGLWGLNHFGPAVAEQIGLEVREYTEDELTRATEYYAEQAGYYADRVDRDENNCAVFEDFSTLSLQAGEGYRALADRYALFSGSADRVKYLLSGKLFSYMGNTGISVPYTAEACVNPDTYEAWIPFTMCHELAHRQAVAAEDAANFCAYLTCMANESPEFRYSGAFAAYIYCNNALYDEDREAAGRIWDEVHPGIRADSKAANAHYDQYEGKVQEAAQKVNDTYLKAFSEESGVKSYGEVADLLIAWYLQNIEE